MARGWSGPPAITGGRLVTDWRADPAVVVALTVAAAAYLFGVGRLRARGVAWSAWRTAAFVVGGLGTVAVALLSGLAAYDEVLFSAHMAQHMLLAMLAPILLALGAPLTLALRTLPRRPRRGLVQLLHSRVARVLTHPVLGWLLFVGTPFALYLTPLYQDSLTHPWLHVLVHVHFLVVGCLFFWPLLGLDPVPGRLPHGLRLLVTFSVLPFHAFLGLAIYSSSQLIAGPYYAALARPWGASLASDQHTAGAILWGTGDLVGLAVFAVLFVQWAGADARTARREDRAQDRAEQAGTDDDVLAAYNARLAALQRRSGPAGDAATMPPTP